MGGEKMSIVVDEAPMQEQPITETQVETQENQQVTEPEQIQEVNGNVADIPAKYAGKSMSEVIEMHQNVEQALGKQGSEVGEQRKLIQSLLEAQNLANTTVEPQVRPGAVLALEQDELGARKRRIAEGRRELNELALEVLDRPAEHLR